MTHPTLQSHIEEMLYKDFVKNFSVISMDKENPRPIIGKFLEGKVAGEDYVGKVTTKEMLEWLRPALRTIAEKSIEALRLKKDSMINPKTNMKYYKDKNIGIVIGWNAARAASLQKAKEYLV